MLQTHNNHTHLPGYVKAYRPLVKSYSAKELCLLYGITYKTLYKWLAPFNKNIGNRKGRFYSPQQVEIIFKKLGVPYEILGE